MNQVIKRQGLWQPASFFSWEQPGQDVKVSKKQYL